MTPRLIATVGDRAERLGMCDPAWKLIATTEDPGHREPQNVEQGSSKEEGESPRKDAKKTGRRND